LSRKINDLIKVPLSKKMLFESIPTLSTITVDYANDEMAFDIQPTAFAVLPTIDSNGYIVLDQVES